MYEELIDITLQKSYIAKIYLNFIIINNNNFK